MNDSFFRLQNKVAVITGAASGIGKAIAEVYTKAGAAVWIADIDPVSAEAAADEIRAQGGAAQAVSCDVTRYRSVEKAVAAILETESRIDILVNNAGIGLVGNLTGTAEEDYDRIMEVNAKGVFLMTKGVLPSMLERQQGVIVNIASLTSLIAIKDRFAYSASKGAVLCMTKSIALDYVDQGIRCNCICPTRIHTPFVDSYLRKNYPGREQEVFQQLSAYQPLGRMGEPVEVAFMALYLASDEAAFLTGAALPLDGGKMMG